MYQSETEICSAALMLLGDSPINSLDDANDRARLCKMIWPMVLDDELSAHRWNCAKRRAELAREAATPAFEWSYQYALPADCLRVLEMQDPTELFAVEDGVLLCNNTTAKIRYLARVTAVGKYSAGLQSALVARMVAELAMAITKKEKVVSAGWAAYSGKILSALASDGQEGSPETLEDRTLVDARA
ncbi:MAG: hypothetical protein A2Z40_03190 [Deltaproteobacteria bacterium RBG_19FT_COMBO_60_16]|nr:MAG: hypothetical protein A2Z40_03190 [Deltaproteobacteria bacterium RBG_19FT_COMBO_60_16]